MNTIFIVMKNSDFTEGRGPMRFDSAFESGPEAVKYVSGQSGICGSPQRVEIDKYGKYAYGNGYVVEEVQLYATAAGKAVIDEEKLRQAALEKLTLRERRLLNLT